MTMKPLQSPGSISRRDVMAVGAAAAAASLPISITAISRWRRSHAEASLLAVFRDASAAVQLGNAVLSAWPHLSNRIVLSALVLHDLGMDEKSVARTDISDIANRLSQNIRQDFAERRTVILDGWVLSVTETRLYALAALAGV